MTTKKEREELALEDYSVVATITRFPGGISGGRVTSLRVDLEPTLKGLEKLDVHSDIVMDMLIYALKLNYDAERDGGSNESPEHYAKDVGRILLAQIKNDDPSILHERATGILH